MAAPKADNWVGPTVIYSADQTAEKKAAYWAEKLADSTAHR